MQRLYAFIRRHPTWVDSFWAVVLLGICGVQYVLGNYPAHERAAAVPIAVGLCTAVALRRRAPEKMLVLTAVMGLAQLALDVQSSLADFAMLLLIYTVAAVGKRWASRFALVGALSAGTLARLRWPEPTVHNWVQEVFFTVVLTVPFVLAWVLGDSMSTRRAYLAQAGGTGRPPGEGARGAVEGGGGG